jgi:hypothetical protein
MKAELLIHDKVKDKDGGIIETKIWSIPKLPEKPHGYEYSLVYIKHGKCVLGYDNAEGKKDHRHYGDKEMPYKFESIENLFLEKQR